MKPALDPALDLSLVELASLFNRSFEGYSVPIAIDAHWLADRIRTERVDLAASRVVRIGKDRVGLALISRRGWTSRLAAMGLVSLARGRGIGKNMLSRLLLDATERGDRAMVLEVIEQNSPALSLYTGAGFSVLNRLVGYSSRENWTSPGDSHDSSSAPARLDEIDVYEVSRRLLDGEPDHFPWQLAGETLAQMGLPFRAFRFGDAYVVVSDPEQSTVTLRALVVKIESRRRGEATRLLSNLARRFPCRIWKVPVLVPETIGEFLFEPLGLSREDLTQLQMRIEF